MKPIDTMLQKKTSVPNMSLSMRCILTQLKNRTYFRQYCTANCDNVRVRFAPSPTGILHLGGLRTALYNYLFARQRNGTFILRVEDTDQTRYVATAIERLEEMLGWCGLVPDEGPSQGGHAGPYVQSERLHLYSESLQTLMQNGYSYRCFCTPVRLDLMRKEAARNGELAGYDNRCRHLTQNEIDEKLAEKKPYAVRFKVDDEPDTWDDLVFGTVRSAKTHGDFIIMKSDNFPTYHFANVVDDHYMGITHVLRGEEWLPSTPKHLAMYKAFNWKPPQYAHLPLILNENGTKLSKRQGDITVEYFKENGYIPEAVLNYITSVGGGFHGNTSGSTLPQLVDKFRIDYMVTNSGRLQPVKLDMFNQLHLERLIEGDHRPQIIERVRHIVKTKLGNSSSSSVEQKNLFSDSYINIILEWAKGHRLSRIEDLVHDTMVFIWRVPDFSKAGSLPTTNLSSNCDIISTVEEALEKMDDFTEDSIKEVLSCCTKENNIKFVTCMKLLRKCLSDHKDGPSVPEMMAILGKTETFRRLHAAFKALEQKKEQTG